MVLDSIFNFHSDKLDTRKPFIVIGYSLSAISKAMIGLAYSWPMAMAARVADRLGKGIRVSARDALIADYTEPKYRGRAFGLHRGFDSAGAAIGPIIAIVLLSVLNKMRDRYYWSPLVALGLFAAFIPFPNEVLVAPLGFMRYRLRHMFLPMFAGNLVFNILSSIGVMKLLDLF